MTKHISDSAKIGQNTKIGFNTIVEENVEIGENCLIGHNVIIHNGSKIGNAVRIDDNTIIGKNPLFSPRSIFKADKFEPANIDDDCLIGANVVIYIGCTIGKKNLIADMSTIRENVSIGNLNIIGRNVAIENFVEIGNRNKFETNVYITAYSKIEDYCFIAPAVATSNDNYMGRDKERYQHFQGITIKRGGRIGVNATILPGKTIEQDGMVAAGSVVTKDVPKEKIVLGSPAREFGKVNDKQLLKNNLDKE
ncbi:MAG: N-acetyltransferase [Candidatus Cloacimonetes bacterium]|nr:N-acetyltransferase [Candidatus Cloacimonadota bacterium]MBS3766945.1 N-acetyltransferase [Candidatus Cloacimonadota bacterium]